MHVIQFWATQPFTCNCLHSSGKCPGLGKNEKLIMLAKADFAWLSHRFGHLIELTSSNGDLKKKKKKITTHGTQPLLKKPQPHTFPWTIRTNEFCCNPCLSKMSEKGDVELWKTRGFKTGNDRMDLRAYRRGHNYPSAASFSAVSRWRVNEVCSWGPRFPVCCLCVNKSCD